MYPLIGLVLQGSIATLRHGILGEALMKLTDYLKQKDSTSISLNLDKCSQDTVLQVSKPERFVAVIKLNQIS